MKERPNDGAFRLRSIGNSTFTVLNSGLIGLSILFLLLLTVIFRSTRDPPIGPLDWRCQEVGELSQTYNISPAQRREAASKGIRLPWTGDNAVTRLSPNRTSGVVRIGNELDNVLAGTSGDDYFRGEKGNDKLVGLKGMDVYVFDIGDGFDIINDKEGPNILTFLASVDIDGITANIDSDGSSLVVHYGQSESIRIEQFETSGEWFIESSCGGDARPLRTLIHP